MPEDTSFA